MVSADLQQRYKVLFSLFVILNLSKALSREKKQEVDCFIQDILNCTGIPGLTLAAVKDGEIVISKGYGKADLARGIDVDHTTLFNIGSITKSFTATLIARLLSQHKRFHWDTPVRDILGNWFYLSNGYLTNHTTLRDLLGMKMGLPRHDGLWLTNTYSRQELMRHVRFMDPVAPFRAKFLYNNIMYTVAAFVAEVLGGEPWEELVKTFLFDPIGMKSTTFINMAPEDYHGFASPYSVDSAYESEEPMPSKLYQVFRSVGPAGSIASNAEDMAKWLLFWLNDATTIHGQQLLTAEELTQFLKPEMSIDLPMKSCPVLFVPKEKYAKGFFRGFYRGFDLLSHSGGMIGYFSRKHIIPGANMGSFVAFNHNGYNIMEPILNLVDDILLGERPWVTASDVCLQVMEIRNTTIQNKNGNLHPLEPLEDVELGTGNYNLTNTTRGMAAYRPLQDYVGQYGNFLYGNITVSLDRTEESLILKQGVFGNFELIPHADESDVFLPIGNTSPVDSINIWGNVYFQSSSNDTSIDRIVWPFMEPSDPPVFVRGLKTEEASPPDIQSCS